jgi:uncharacterized protein (DUF952 family)
MKKCFWLLQILLFTGVFMSSEAYGDSLNVEQSQRIIPPSFLYKVLTSEDWKKSQSQNSVILSKDDQDFIHLATEEQLPRITGKYWSKVPEYVVLKLDTNQLSGRLVYEVNPGGENKYYHLYQGSIPLKAVLEAIVVNSKK